MLTNYFTSYSKKLAFTNPKRPLYQMVFKKKSGCTKNSYKNPWILRFS